MSLLTFQEMKRLFIFSGIFYMFMVLKQLKVNFFGTTSRLFGKFSRLRLPKLALVPLLKVYSAIYGVNVEEMEVRSLWNFSTFSSFFTRRLKSGIRKIADREDPHSICSPCDGTVYNIGD